MQALRRASQRPLGIEPFSPRIWFIVDQCIFFQWTRLTLASPMSAPALAEIQIHHSEIRRPMTLHIFSLIKCQGIDSTAPSGLE